MKNLNKAVGNSIQDSIRNPLWYSKLCSLPSKMGYGVGQCVWNLITDTTGDLASSLRADIKLK